MIDAIVKYLAGLNSPLKPWRDVAPEKAKYPLAVLTLVSLTPDQSAINEGGADEAVIQVDCYALTLAAAQALAERYRAALDRPGNPVRLSGVDCLFSRLDSISADSERLSGGSDQLVYRVTLEFTIIAE